MADQLRVIISSTARDLPEHRKEVMDACLRQGMFPIMMEHLPASDDEAIPASLRMVDDADIYLLILAHRYGYIPKANNPTQISVTEHEYNRAVERKIPTLTYVMHEDHPVKAADVEKGEGAVKLEAFKNRALLKVTNFFKSPAELRANVVDSLSARRQKDLTAFHYVSEIPDAPDIYIAHPYTLLQTHTLIGRQAELKVLTDWITGKELEIEGIKAPAESVRIMCVVAIGGMGKSALTWKWFNEVAPQEMKDLAGGMWWSFYESDATFENFVTRALAYVIGHPLDEVQQIPAPERETQLLAVLDRKPFFLVLDGLERILIAYSRMDASRFEDSDVGKEKNLRKNADPRVGSFLKKLTQVARSRILVSSRLYPAELEIATGEPIPGTLRLKIGGLTDADAVELWRAFEVSGSRDELLPVFSTFGKHPLLIQALAGEVKRYRKSPGNFEEWRRANPQFDPTKRAELKEAMGHVLEFALRGLNKKTEKALQVIAAFRMPTGYDTLTAVLVGEDKACATEPELDAVLSELEDRGLVGWDKRANRYDLHPIVRGVVWENLGDDSRRGIYNNLYIYFEALSEVDSETVEAISDLTRSIEMYNTLIGLRRYDEAHALFKARLNEPTLYRFATANRQVIELLEMLFADGLEQLPTLSDRHAQADTLNSLAIRYRLTGQPKYAASFLRRANAILDSRVMISNLGDSYKGLGKFYESEIAGRRALVRAREQHDPREAIVLTWLGHELATRGDIITSKRALLRALKIVRSQGQSQWDGYVSGKLAQLLVWMNEIEAASSLADRAFRLAQEPYVYEPGLVEALRLAGEGAIGLGTFSAADEQLHAALTHARIGNLVEEELAALVRLAELRRRQGVPKPAQEFLDEVWELAERGPYPLIHADACNVLAQIERDEGNATAAIEAATKAYRLAWCDGPPFAYYWGLEKAKEHLKELGAPEPEMPPFDESKFEPMPAVEINPRDEFYFDEASIN